MAFNGVLFKFGEFNFPNRHIKFDTYSIAPNQRQDIDSYTDANGVTHRNALEHTKTQVQFTTWEMKESDMDYIMSNIVQNYMNPNERNALCTYFDPETRTYKTGVFYLDPSLQFRICSITNGILNYGETQFTFIEY